MRRSRRLLAALVVAGSTAAACALPVPAAPRAAGAAAAPLADWPEFGLNPQRSNATGAATGITPATIHRLRRRVVALPGTADSSAIYLHDAVVNGAAHDVVVVTTSYGITVAIDAARGRILWRFVPRGLAAWRGSARITTASPLAAGGFVYATSPDGRVHKLALAGGREAPGWPVRVTPDPT